jgi:hypothetical protein
MLQNLDNEWNNFVDSGKEVCLSISELNNNKPNVCISYLMAKKNNIIFKKWVQECEKIFFKRKKIKELKWSGVGGHLLGKIIVDNNYHNLIFPFPNKITYRYGWRNFSKYYITDEHFIENEINKIHNYKLIILYGKFMYEKNIPEKSVLNYFLNYKSK